MRFPRPQLNYANVIATIALFVALGGAAIAAGLPKNSVGAKQLKRGAVTAAKLKRGAVTSGKIAPKAVTAGKLGANAVLPGNLGNGVISTEKIGDGAVIAGKIKNGAVTTNKLNNGAVTSAKLDDGAVNTGKLADGAVTPAKLSVPLGGSVSTLQSGQTLRGVFDIGGRSGGPQGKFEEHWSQSFPIPLLNAPSADEANIMKPGQTSTNCPGITGGNAATPQAAPGQLCVYITKELEYEDGNFDADSVSRLGFGLVVVFKGEPEKDHYLKGYWAVTAP
ncbi:MAG TPA: hypothetical protein VFP17_03875 [Solirubrobacterales bacterium]|nr:hypothetical protein [Solirubrobacterales bacterium]